MPPEDHWDRLIRGLRTGDEEIVAEFCAQYGRHLHAVAEKNIATGLRRRVGPESIMQSAYRTFFRRAREGQFDLADSEDLWRLLCAITLTKVREQARYHLRHKRAVNRETDVGAAEEAGERRQPTAPGPTPAEAAALAEQFEVLLASLDEEEQQIVELKLQELTNLEVADRLGCSDRTVSRILARIKDRLEQSFESP